MSELEKLANRKQLPIAFLTENGVEETAKGIQFANGNARIRIRARANSQKTFWAEGDTRPMRVYGYDRVEQMALHTKTALIVEGESDSLTAWFHKRPALGVPGSSLYEKLKLEDVSRFDRVAVIREPDEAGRKFAINVPMRLRELGYSGDVVIVNLPTKDLSDLHIEYAEREAEFDRVLEAAIENGMPVEIPADPRGETPVRAVHLVLADSIEPVETGYIVRPYIPRGEATWLEGVTKTGKTMVALDIIARITTGRPFVNGEPIEIGNVAIITCEDDPARTLVPRLIAVGADRARVSFVQVRERGEERHIAFLSDLHAIEGQLRSANVSLVFVDGRD
ncbi:MAG: AAA family ATPase [Vulcanimicrobiaceae bacterium]